MELNEIQEASVEHILKVLKRKTFSMKAIVGDEGFCFVESPPTFPPRYLLADEVGLGKTITTAGVIEKLADEKGDKPFNVYYVCGNERITNQNKKRLEECCGISNGLSNKRLTMQTPPTQTPPTKKDANIRIFPITPAVAFTSKNSRFNQAEFEKICEIYQNKYQNNLPLAVESAMDQIKSLRVEDNNSKGQNAKGKNEKEISQELFHSALVNLKVTLQGNQAPTHLSLLSLLDEIEQKLGDFDELLEELQHGGINFDVFMKNMNGIFDEKFQKQIESLKPKKNDKHYDQHGIIYDYFTNNYHRVSYLEEQFQILRKHAFQLQVTELNPPDLIVLDEFQNYSELIEAYHVWQKDGLTYEAYLEDESTTVQDNKLYYPRFNLMMDSAPVLLLSATPFGVVSKDVHDTDEYATTDQLQEEDEQEDDSEKELKADFMPAKGLKYTEDSFASVFRFITGVDYDSNKNDHKKPSWLYENMFCRTQRSNFYTVNQESMIVERFPTIDQTVAHLEYNKKILGVAESSSKYPLLSPKKMLEESESTLLEEMTLLELAPLLQTSMTDSQKQNWVKISPAFVNFSSWYESIFQDVNQKDFTYTQTMLSTENHGNWDKCTNHGNALEASLAVGADGHGGYEFLKETVLPEGVEDMLWIPPVISHSMAYQNDKNPFWKNKDYSKTLVFTKYRMSTQSLAYFMCQEREKRCGEKQAEYEKANNEQSRGTDFPDELGNGYFQRVLKTIPKEDSPKKEEEENLETFLINLFNNNMALIQRVTGKSGIDAVNEYAQMGGLMAVIEEYLFVAGEKACPAGKSSQVTVLLEKKKMFNGNNKIKPDLGFAERFTADLGDVKGSSRTEESYLQDRFNSPFFPFMMTATSTAQEGLDFHNYSHNMFHFSIPETPVVFRQREGRIDRRRSHLMRKRLRAFLTPPNPPTMEGLYNKAYGVQKATYPPNPLFPDWYVPDVPNIYYSRQVWAMPASIEKSHFQKMKAAQKDYDTFLGDSFGDGKAFCPFLQQKKKTP